MKYATAVRRLRETVQECEEWAGLDDQPLVVGVHVFGELLTAPENLERVQLAFSVDLPAEEVTWFTEPASAAAFAHISRIDRYPFEYYWRPAVWPVWNHYIKEPVELWSLFHGQTEALDALAERRFGDLHRLVPSAEVEFEQYETERAASEHHLRQVLDNYFDSDWRRGHDFNHLQPEDHLWRAAYGLLDIPRG